MASWADKQPELKRDESECCDDAGVSGDSRLIPGIELFNVPNVDSCSVHGDGLTHNLDNNREFSNVLIQEQCDSNFDHLVKDGEQLSSYLDMVDKNNSEILESSFDSKVEITVDNTNTNCSVLTEKKVENRNCDNNFDEGHLQFHDNEPQSHSKLPPSNRLIGQKPGVILLGRGNSFSLGRSEVILLHHRPRPLKDKRMAKKHGNDYNYNSSKEENNENGNGCGTDEESFHLQTIDESERLSTVETIVVKMNTIEIEGICGVESVKTAIPSSSPPPISNGLCHLDIQESARMNGDDSNNSSNRVVVPCYGEDVRNLWEKAESLMALRNDSVCKILEEFGIGGEPGGGGGEDLSDWEDEDVEERKKEEEEVWQIIQENFRV